MPAGRERVGEDLGEFILNGVEVWFWGDGREQTKSGASGGLGIGAEGEGHVGQALSTGVGARVGRPPEGQ